MLNASPEHDNVVVALAMCRLGLVSNTVQGLLLMQGKRTKFCLVKIMLKMVIIFFKMWNMVLHLNIGNRFRAKIFPLTQVMMRTLIYM